MLPWQHELIVTVQRSLQRAAWKAVNIWLQTGDLEHASRPHQLTISCGSEVLLVPWDTAGVARLLRF